MTDKSNLLSDLARAKAVFQQRAVTAALGIWPAGSKPDQDVDASQTGDPVGKEG